MHSLYFLDITQFYWWCWFFQKLVCHKEGQFVSKTTRIPDVTIRAQRGRIGAESFKSSQVFAEFSGADSHCNRLLCLWTSKIIDIRLQIATFGKDAYELLKGFCNLYTLNISQAFDGFASKLALSVLNVLWRLFFCKIFSK